MLIGHVAVVKNADFIADFLVLVLLLLLRGTDTGGESQLFMLHKHDRDVDTEPLAHFIRSHLHDVFRWLQYRSRKIKNTNQR